MMDPKDDADAALTDALDSGQYGEFVDQGMDSGTNQSLLEARHAQLLLKSLEKRPVPVHFERRVQTRVRRRTGGRYYSYVPPPIGVGLGIDVFVILAVVVMAACWFMNQQVVFEPQFFVDPPSSLNAPSPP
ncbi:MAG: hypothetical protein VYA30_10260 [Myxococcota bacterium]|nr:hypothetical protein [Myxococcota bacterium]